MRTFVCEMLERRSLLAGGILVNSLTLINADTNQPIRVLVAEDAIDFATLGTHNLNIRADTSADVKSVRFGLDSNSSYRTENTAPFALAGDSSGDYNPWIPALGHHVVTATPYSATGASGTAGAMLSIGFTVAEGPTFVASPASVAFSAPQAGSAPS